MYFFRQTRGSLEIYFKLKFIFKFFIFKLDVFQYSRLKLGKKFWISLILVLNKCKLVFLQIEMTRFYLK